MKTETPDLVFPLVEAIAEAKDVAISDLPPLSDTIDLDALERLLADDQPDGLTVSFTHAEMRVVVHSADLIYVEPAKCPQADSKQNCVGTESLR